MHIIHDTVASKFYTAIFVKVESWIIICICYHHKFQISLRVRLDVDIERLGIELGSIPIQPLY
jgi:hypothetical protein